MDPFTLGAIISGGSSILGGILQNKSNAQQADKNRDYENEQAERQMAFQERMATTEYQRAVADMRAAGINPILAAKLGGNSSPSGASGSGSSAHMENVFSEAGAVPMQAMKMKADLELTKEMTKTETSKQAANYANAGGYFGAPGFLKVPFSSAKNAAEGIATHRRVLTTGSAKKPDRADPNYRTDWEKMTGRPPAQLFTPKPVLN